MPETNTARSKRYLEKQGYVVAVTEKDRKAPKPGSHPCNVCHQQPQIAWKVDTFGFGDLLICGNGEIALVQTTTTSNQASRVEKILPISEAESWLKSNGKIYVHGWKKRKKTGRWELTVTVIELDKDFGGMRARGFTLEDSPLFLQNAS